MNTRQSIKWKALIAGQCRNEMAAQLNNKTVQYMPSFQNYFSITLYIYTQQHSQLKHIQTVAHNK